MTFNAKLGLSGHSQMESMHVESICFDIPEVVTGMRTTHVQLPSLPSRASQES